MKSKIDVPEKATIHPAEILHTDPKSSLQAWYWNYDYGIGEGWLRSVSKIYFATQKEAEKDLAASQVKEISLRSIDIGFDPRVQKMHVTLPACLRITVHTDDGTLSGTLPDVIDVLHKRNWQVYRDIVAPGPIKGKELGV